MSRLLQRILRTTLVCLPALAACDSSDEPGAGNTGGAGGTSGATSVASGGGAAASGGSGGSTMMGSGGTGTMNMAGSSIMGQGGSMAMAGSGNVAPQPPVVQSVTPMGGLHVVWTNASSDCDKIELLRNKDGGESTIAYTLTGAATSQHDSQVSAPGTYCYKARCVIGIQTSPESAEKCGTL